MVQDYISFLQFFTTTNKKIVKGKSTNATISRVKFNSTYQLLGFSGTDESNLIDSLSLITSDSACTFNKVMLDAENAQAAAEVAKEKAMADAIAATNAAAAAAAAAAED